MLFFTAEVAVTQIFQSSSLLNHRGTELIKALQFVVSVLCLSEVRGAAGTATQAFLLGRGRRE